MDVNQIRKDRLRYTKNKISSSLALVAILLNVLYFVNIYRSDIGTYYYTWLTGASIIYNLLFMMFVFLCSEGVKNYNYGYSAFLIVVGALQFVRTLIIPAKAHAATVELASGTATVMSDAQYTKVILYLCVSGILCILGGVIGILKTKQLNDYNKELAAQQK